MGGMKRAWNRFCAAAFWKKQDRSCPSGKKRSRQCKAPINPKNPSQAMALAAEKNLLLLLDSAFYTANPVTLIRKHRRHRPCRRRSPRFRGPPSRDAFRPTAGLRWASSWWHRDGSGGKHPRGIPAAADRCCARRCASPSRPAAGDSPAWGRDADGCC